MFIIDAPAKHSLFFFFKVIMLNIMLQLYLYQMLDWTFLIRLIDQWSVNKMWKRPIRRDFQSYLVAEIDQL